MTTVDVQSELAEVAAIDRPSFYASEPDQVHAAFARLRREEPVFWYEPAKVWVITKHEDIKFIGRSPDLFSTESGTILGHNIEPAKVLDQLPEWAREPLRDAHMPRAQQRHLVAKANLSLGDPRIENLMLSDPPRHGELRKIFSRALSPRLINEITSTTQSVARETIGSFEEGTTTNWMESVAEVVPADVVAHIIRVPLGRDRDQFIEWGKAFFAAADLTEETDLEEVERIKASNVNFLGYLAELVKERRKKPGDDLVSQIVTAELDGKPISDGMAMMFIGILFIGGGGSARHLVCRLPHAFAEHRDQRELVLANRDLIGPSVEECLRYYPITWQTCRTASESLTLRDKVIERDDYVVLMFPSGNRDEDAWERPNTFDITRSHQPGIVAFGWGTHMCAGNQLARMTGRAVLGELLERFPNWELAGPPVRKTNLNKNMLSDLPVRFVS